MYSYIWKTLPSVKGESRQDNTYVEGLVPLMWREHCLECAMPLCYKTCALYFPRMDKRCLRFENGIVPVEYGEGAIRGAEIHFRRWAKLQTNLPHTLSVSTVNRGRTRDFFHDRLGRVLRGICDLIHQYRMCQIYASLAERINTRIEKTHRGKLANYFIASINNKESEQKTLLLEIISDDKSIYKTSFVLNPGWNEFSIPLIEINLPSDDSKQNFLRAYLNNNETGTLQFRYFDFALIAVEDGPKPAKKVKCVGWDLDNTLWQGVIGDAGKEGVKLNNEAVSLIKELDERGILQTIVSKNTYEVVWPFIQELGLDEYFLYPAINWGRKSRNLMAIAKELNINIDTFALIDDSVFERNEVKNELPQVRVYDVTEINVLLQKSEFDVPVSPETKARRASYQTEEKRKTIRASWDGDYNSFLRSCEMKMRLFTPKDDASTERCLELINRSNQYNISGVRYTRDEFTALLTDKNTSCYAISVSDKYGDYGIVGFASVVITEDVMRLKDFVMSCRVAQKKVERTFINELISDTTCDTLLIELKKTQRNLPLQEEFKKMNLVIDEDTEEKLNMHLNLSDYTAALDDDIFTITTDL